MNPIKQHETIETQPLILREKEVKQQASKPKIEKSEVTVSIALGRKVTTLEMLPCDALTKTLEFLPKDEWAVALIISRKVSDILLSAAWKCNFSMRIYQKFLASPGTEKWFHMQKRISADLSWALKLVKYNGYTFQRLPQKPPAHLGDLLHIRFPDFRQLLSIVFKGTLLYQYDKCYETQQAENLYPTRSGGLCGKKRIVDWTGISACLSCFVPLFLNCCVPLPLSLCCCCSVSVASGTALPSCTAAVCCLGTNREDYVQTVARLHELETSHAVRIRELSKWPTPTELEAIEDPAKQISFLLSRINTLFFLLDSTEPNLSSKRKTLLYWLRHIDSPYATNPFRPSSSHTTDNQLKNVWIINQGRLASGCVIAPPAELAQALQKACIGGDIATARNLIVNHHIDVNAPACIRFLFDTKENPDLLRLFVNAGVDLQEFPSISPYQLHLLLEAGLFVNDQELLDTLCAGRYDLAFVLFLYGLRSPKILMELSHNAYMDLEAIETLVETTAKESLEKIDRTLYDQTLSYHKKCTLAEIPHIPTAGRQLFQDCINKIIATMDLPAVVETPAERAAIVLSEVKQASQNLLQRLAIQAVVREPIRPRNYDRLEHRI